MDSGAPSTVTDPGAPSTVADPGDYETHEPNTDPTEFVILEENTNRIIVVTGWNLAANEPLNRTIDDGDDESEDEGEDDGDDEGDREDDGDDEGEDEGEDDGDDEGDREDDGDDEGEDDGDDDGDDEGDICEGLQGVHFDPHNYDWWDDDVVEGGFRYKDAPRDLCGEGVYIHVDVHNIQWIGKTFKDNTGARRSRVQEERLLGQRIATRINTFMLEKGCIDPRLSERYSPFVPGNLGTIRNAMGMSDKRYETWKLPKQSKEQIMYLVQDLGAFSDLRRNRRGRFTLKILVIHNNTHQNVYVWYKGGLIRPPRNRLP